MKKLSFESQSCSSEQFGDEFGLGNPAPSVSYAVILFGNVFLHLGMTQTTRPCWCSTVCMKKRSFGRISPMFQDFLTIADCIVCEFHFRKINTMWSAFDAWLNNRYGRLTHETRKHTNQTPNYNGRDILNHYSPNFTYCFLWHNWNIQTPNGIYQPCTKWKCGICVFIQKYC